MRLNPNPIRNRLLSVTSTMRRAFDSESPFNLLSVSPLLSQWTMALMAQRRAGGQAGCGVMQQCDRTVWLPKVNEALEWTAEQQDFLLASWVFATLQIESLALMLPTHWNYLPLFLLLPDALSLPRPYMHSPQAVFFFVFFFYCRDSATHPHSVIRSRDSPTRLLKTFIHVGCLWGEHILSALFLAIYFPSTLLFILPPAANAVCRMVM